ncbi:2-polyprenyl-3-methyl-5-hydroxy-6-metoxy-1,4-benzoquinol methylase [Kribbella aluminosa]|uniref:2-polyprenyl-3-methyl-5-hydroxy-6-metoxy-1, 4-benzoquinol methylase n=1 Tax=Kribbella aluminosa TaxID=416017 RepID=A0ABS4UKN9_9ACTN|nr:class I SAM-dependent methyltransferase [Kribbella aluminosa]MBP2352202.1 2-polyprenyl-3-methyl-5-hydroxy-6-metoxy-1,4-benzoquinol methylase [Kribbella aluminosa]
MRYYYAEHQAAYQQLQREGLTQWNDLHGERWTFDDFPNRAFLESVLDRLPTAGEVLEYGCGTGPAACFLAERGFRVDAIDLIPEAIELARRFARERGVQVNFSVQDVCALPSGSKRYDVVLDSYCLQSIVTDTDRAKVLAAVRDRLNGYYVLSTAVYNPERVYENGFRYDARTGICYQETPEPTADAVQLDGTWYLPHRRHLHPEALQTELEQAGLHT